MRLAILKNTCAIVDLSKSSKVSTYNRSPQFWFCDTLEKYAILLGLISRRYAKSITTEALLSKEKADYHILNLYILP